MPNGFRSLLKLLTATVAAILDIRINDFCKKKFHFCLNATQFYQTTVESQQQKFGARFSYKIHTLINQFDGGCGSNLVSTGQEKMHTNFEIVSGIGCQQDHR